MGDVNLLPDDLRGAEEKERAKGAGSVSLPMSTPTLIDRKGKQSLGVTSVATPKKDDTDEAKRVRSESYIGIDRSGKIVHEEKKVEPVARQLPWWRRWFRPRVTIHRVPATPAKPPKPPTPTISAIQGTVPREPLPEKRPSAPIRAGGTALRQSVPPPSASGMPAKVAAQPAKPGAPGSGKRMSEPTGRDPLGPPPLGVNLIPQEWLRAELNPSLRPRLLMAAAAFLLLSLVGSLFARSWYLSRQSARVSSLRSDLANVEAGIAALQEKDRQWLDLRARLHAINSTLARHVNMLPAFRAVEQSVIPEVRYASINVTSSGTISLEGETLSQELLARQLKALEAMPLKPTKVTLSSYSTDVANQRVAFTISVEFPKEALYAGPLN